MRFQNFHIWRGRLPHWRADDVSYYVTFRHRRELNENEIRLLTTGLIRPEGRKWSLQILCVQPDVTEMVLEMIEGPKGVPELSDIVEKTKAKVSRKILKASGERFDVFYRESFDRIIRDSTEFEETFARILEAAASHTPDDDPESWAGLYVPDRT